MTDYPYMAHCDICGIDWEVLGECSMHWCVPKEKESKGEESENTTN